MPDGASQGNVRQKARQDAAALKAFIEDRVARGEWQIGQRLPTERELVEMLGIARNTVRKTLDEFVRNGWIDRQVGRGTFLAGGPAEVDSGPSKKGIWLLDAGPADVIECRLLFEPAMAGLAVTRATYADVDGMEYFVRQGGAAEDWQMFEHWDETLHQAIAEATRNPAVIQINRNLSRVRRQSEWGKLKARGLTAERRARLQDEHVEIVRAIRERDIDRAESHMRNHLLHVRAYMFNSGDLDQSNT